MECKCLDPMQPGGREGKLHWLKAVQENKDVASSDHEDADVVFYGDSITEGWRGTSYGFPNGRKENNLEVYNSLFSLEHGGKYKGLTLGISGDRVSEYGMLDIYSCLYAPLMFICNYLTLLMKF